jgi:hypothetical protein
VTRDKLLEAIKGHVLEEAEMVAVFQVVRVARAGGWLLARQRSSFELGTGVSPRVFFPNFLCRYPPASMDHKGRRRSCR